LVPAKGRRRSATGKVTVGLASHWPCVTDYVVYPPTGSMALKGRWAPHLRSGGARPTLPLPFYTDTAWSSAVADVVRVERRPAGVSAFAQPQSAAFCDSGIVPHQADTAHTQVPATAAPADRAHWSKQQWTRTSSRL